MKEKQEKQESLGANEAKLGGGQQKDVIERPNFKTWFRLGFFGDSDLVFCFFLNTQLNYISQHSWC